MSFGKGDAPKRPQYEQWAGNNYTTQAGELVNTMYGLLNDNVGSVNVFTPEQQSYYEGLAGQYTQSQWNDLNRGYTNAINQMNQRNYNRFGTTGSTGSLYDTQSLQKTYNDLASRIASNTASMYNDLINQDYNRRMNTLNYYNNLYNQAGQVINAMDIANWQIRNKNKENTYLDDVDVWNNKGTIPGLLGNTIMGAFEGFNATKNPWGALAGGIGGSLQALGNKNYF